MNSIRDTHEQRHNFPFVLKKALSALLVFLYSALHARDAMSFIYRLPYTEPGFVRKT